MTLKDALTMLSLLDDLKNIGGKRFKEITRLLNMEATTYNTEEAAKMLKGLR